MNVFQMRQFFLAYREKIQTPSGLSDAEPIVQTPSGLSHKGPLFPLSWSHYVRLLTVPESQARLYYENESLRGGWSVRDLDRQIASRAYERLRSKKRSSISKADQAAADYEIRDPFALEFLDLKDEYSESDLETALINELERFLLELGNDFAFVARQRRLRVGTEWYRVDLLLFHRRLRCLVVIDLKIGKFTHSDAGQMNLYLNYARAHWSLPDENPPVGLILCSERDAAVAHYALRVFGTLSWRESTNSPFPTNGAWRSRSKRHVTVCFNLNHSSIAGEQPYRPASRRHWPTRPENPDEVEPGIHSALPRRCTSARVCFD
jgi:predicted nuclease of restriction endonuclease-like (RecB) superfamily